MLNDDSSEQHYIRYFEGCSDLLKRVLNGLIESQDEKQERAGKGDLY